MEDSPLIYQVWSVWRSGERTRASNHLWGQLGARGHLTHKCILTHIITKGLGNRAERGFGERVRVAPLVFIILKKHKFNLHADKDFTRDCIQYIHVEDVL